MADDKKDKEKAEAATSALENFQNKTKPKCKRKARESIRFQLPCGAGLVLSGQVAKTLWALVKAGQRGVTSLEISSWALRTSAYIFDLRHKWRLVIEMKPEPHPDGWHGRYILLSGVKILPDVE